MKLSTSLLLIALFNQGAALAAPPRPRQVKASAPKATDELLADPLRYSAFSAIVKEVERAKEYRQVSARAQVLAAAADALWDFDPEKCRGLLREAYAQADRATAAPREGEGAAFTAARTTALQGRLRAEVLSVAQRRDPALVGALLEGREENQQRLLSLHQDPLVFGSSSFQKRGLAQLAARLAPNDPAQAVEHAAASLGFGVPQEFQEVFRALIAADPKRAHELFERATRVYAADPSPNLYDGLFLLSYLRLLPRPESDTQLARTFLGTAFDRARRVHEKALASGPLDAGLRQALVNNLNQLQPFFRVYWPAKAEEVASLSRQIAAGMRPEEMLAEELFPTEASRNDPEEILSRAEAQKDEDNRDALYFQAALTLSKKGEHERALSVAGRARPGERREAVAVHVRRALAQQLIADGQLEEALRVIEKIEAPEERADVTLALVGAARKRKDLALATGVLDATRKLLANPAGSAPHARAYLWLASAYSTVDAQAGFELMAAAVKQANAARGLDDVRTEPKLLQLGGASRYAIQVGDTKGDFRAGFRLLARADFARAVSLAEGFENEMLRGISLVTAANSVLKQPPSSPH